MKKITYILITVLVFVGICNTAQALTVSPAKLEITGDPGSVVSGEIEVFNEQDESKVFYTSYENFEPRGDSGAPYFVGSNSGLATWIDSQKEITIASGERAVFPYTVTIPEDAKPGGYFAAIFLGNQPPSSTGGSEVTIGGKIGVLVLLRVSGDIEEKGGLLSFISKGGQRFFSTLPISFEYTINNLGGDRIVPKGEIRIKNSIWLNTATLLANKNEGSVLPNSSRKFEVTWDKKEKADTKKQNSENIEEDKKGFFGTAGEQLKDFHLGFYTARLDVSWGVTNQTAKDSFVFFVFPWQLLSIVVVILCIFGFFGLKVLKKYNSWIISQARVSIQADQEEEKPTTKKKTVKRAPNTKKNE